MTRTTAYRKFCFGLIFAFFGLVLLTVLGMPPIMGIVVGVIFGICVG